MKAIILAAGRSERLLPLTKNLPKCLLSFGEKSILEYELDLLRVCGICEIIIVDGFAAERIEKIAGKDVTYIYNKHFLSTNSVYSLFLAREHLNSEILLLNSDVLVEPGILKRLVEEEFPNAVAVDLKKELTDGEMNVKVSKGFIIEISKNIPAKDADGESVQLAKFDEQSAKELKKEITRLIDNGDTDKFPTCAYKPIIENYGLKAVDTDGMMWGEVDTLEDYKYACSRFRQIWWDKLN